jgi:hypothetical protein
MIGPIQLAFLLYTVCTIFFSSLAHTCTYNTLLLYICAFLTILILLLHPQYFGFPLYGQENSCHYSLYYSTLSQAAIYYSNL